MINISPISVRDFHTFKTEGARAEHVQIPQSFEGNDFNEQLLILHTVAKTNFL